MKTGNKNLALVTGISSLILLFLQLFYLNFNYFGWVVILLFLYSSGFFWHNTLNKLFRFKRNELTTFLLGGFLSVFVTGFISSSFIVFYKLNLITIIVSFLLSFLLAFGVDFFAPRCRKRFIDQDEFLPMQDFLVFTSHHFLTIVYLLLWGFSFYLLQGSTSVEALATPWFAIDISFVYTFFAATLVLFFFLLSAHKTKLVLFLIILHSVLLHSYLPLSHEMPFGGDVWRHIGIEERIANGEPIRPILFGRGIETTEVFGLQIPKVFSHVQQYSYGLNWSLASVVSQIAQIDLLTINKWLAPILWGVFIPIIFFYIGIVIFSSVKKSLWLSALTLLPFSFQALGSLTLPVSFGYLFFFFAILLWLIYQRDGFRWQKWFIFGIGFLMLFGYLLHALIFWFVILVGLLFDKVDYVNSKIVRGVVKTAGVLLGILFVPFVEIISGISKIPKSISIQENFEKLVATFSGWNYMQNIEMYDTLVGNFLINHTPNYAFVLNIFTQYRYHVFLGVVLIWVLALVGIYRIIKSDSNRLNTIGFILLIALSGNTVGWFLLEGNRILTRRLDLMVAAGLVIVALCGFFEILSFLNRKKQQKRKVFIKLVLFATIFSLSWLTMTTYTSGPDMRVVSKNKYQVAKYIWNNSSEKKQCVIADPWSLLVLQGVSARKVVAGGFAEGKNHDQKEVVQMWDQLQNKSDRSVLVKSHKLTGIDNCWVSLLATELTNKKINRMNNITNSKPKYIGDYAVWREKQLKNTTKSDKINSDKN